MGSRRTAVVRTQSLSTVIPVERQLSGLAQAWCLEASTFDIVASTTHEFGPVDTSSVLGPGLLVACTVIVQNISFTAQQVEFQASWVAGPDWLDTSMSLIRTFEAGEIDTKAANCLIAATPELGFRVSNSGDATLRTTVSFTALECNMRTDACCQVPPPEG